MKTKRLFISFAAFAAASVLMSSCSNEESTATTNEQLTAFTGGIVTEVPMERVQIGTPGITTRTSMNRDKIGGQGVFLWEPKDVIYVKDDKDKLCKSQNEITKSAPRTTFLVNGTYTTKGQYEVYYYGTNTGAGAKKVVIASDQTQSEFNNTKHFGAVGDCGVATATKTTAAGKSGYKFDLEHKASYLCFLPYMASQEDRANFKIKRIEITSKADNISGTYDLTQDGLSATGTNESKTITLNVGTDGNGLALADQNTATTSIKNSLYVVIAPGERKLSVKYTVFSIKENKELTLTKQYKSHTFAVNRICDIPVSLGSADLNGGHKNADGSDELEEDFTYTGKNYYMWDAAENYWSGHEWDATTAWQPIENDATNNGYPKSKGADGARWYHEGSGSFEASVNPLFKELPNANELGWYVKNGDAHWDESTQWTAFGKVHTGGIWLKKLSVIAQENNKKLAELKLKDPKGKDLRASFYSYGIYTKSGKPADSEISKYFFLPALGYYYDGKLYHLGSVGCYWSSSADPSSDINAYYLSFDGEYLGLYNVNYRYSGYVAQPFE